MQLQFLAPVVFFLSSKKGKFNHFGRSEAWNSAHHRRYVFPSLRSAASLSISFSVSVSVCCVWVVVVVCVCLCVRVSRCVWSKRNESECLDMCTCNRQ